MRESLFAALGDCDGARVLDLYAGSGALGIEALSRGAAHATFVDRAASSVAALRRNLDDLAVLNRARVMRDDALRAIKRLTKMGEIFDVVFADPPYASNELERLLAEPATRALLAPQGTLVVESERRHSLPTPEGLTAIDTRRYGDTIVTCFAPARTPETSERARGAASE